LIVLADQPFIRPETFRQIVDQYRRSDAQIVIPTYKGFRGNPVLLDRSVFPESVYVGLVANKKRGQEILASLERGGEPADKLATVRVPAGLDIGAETPEEIALNILAEIVSRRTEKRRE
jgi:CTP:molybdopterin cytidylyltransferase MocA